jgi:predicted DNA-binding WGR domain protein
MIGASIRFELVDAKRNRRRFYALALTEDRQLPLLDDAPGVVVLVVSRGRIGGKPIVRREPFTVIGLAIERWGELARARRRHGYAEVSA